MLLRRITNHVSNQNWFAVFLDFLIVILGILIAFQITNWNEKSSKRTDFELAKAAIESDLLVSYFNAQERIALKTCRISSLREISTRLLQAGGEWDGLPHEGSDSEDLAVKPVLRSPSRDWGSRAWEAELARGTLNLMDPTRQKTIDFAFTLAEKAQRLQDEILSLEAQLKILSEDTELPKSDRIRYFEIVSVIDQKSLLLEKISENIAETIEGLNIRVPDEFVRTVTDSFPVFDKGRREIYGDCAGPLELFYLDAQSDKATP